MLCVDAHEPSVGAIRVKLSVQYISKIKSLPKHPAHDAVFHNKYMKLSDARPNVIRTCSLRIKQFLTDSNIDISDILETPSYFVLPPKIVLDLMHLKIFMEIRDKYRYYISIYTDGSRDGNSVACATVFQSNISMKLPDSASIFTAEIWAIIKALEVMKHSVASDAFIHLKEGSYITPQCEHCQRILTVRHILVAWNHFAKIKGNI